MMRLPSLLVLALVNVVAAPIAVSASGFSVGDAPPPLGLEHVVQGPEGLGARDLSWDSLAGQVVVLEFWATWCAPCRAAIPHMNELADALAGEPVVFISITDEDPETASDFASRRRMASIVACDTDESLFDALHVRSIPATLIVGRDGRIAAMTHPTLLKEESLRRVLAGERLEDLSGGERGQPDVVPADQLEAAIQMALATPPGSARAGQDPAVVKGTPDALAQVIIRPYDEPNHMTSTSGDSVTALGQTAESILWRTYDIHPNQMIIEATLPEDRFALVAKAPSLEATRALLRASVDAAFGVRCEIIDRDVDVFLLKAPNGPPEALIQSDFPGSSFTTSGEGVVFESCTIEYITQTIGERTGRPVINATGLEGKWSGVIKCDINDPADVRRAIRDAGFMLEPAVRPMKHLLVRPAVAAGADREER
jgi:uncharacterized protein (TIGR03435 family)